MMATIHDELTAVERELEERRRRLARRSMIAAAIPLALAAILFVGAGGTAVHYQGEAVELRTVRDSLAGKVAALMERAPRDTASHVNTPPTPLPAPHDDSALRRMVDSLRHAIAGMHPAGPASLPAGVLALDDPLASDIKLAGALAARAIAGMNGGSTAAPPVDPMKLMSDLAHLQVMARETRRTDTNQIRVLNQAMMLSRWVAAQQKNGGGSSSAARSTITELRGVLARMQAENARLRDSLARYVR